VGGRKEGMEEGWTNAAQAACRSSSRCEGRCCTRKSKQIVQGAIARKKFVIVCTERAACSRKR